MLTITQNLAIALLGLVVDDFECEEQYLSFTSEQCYHIRLIVRRLTYMFKKFGYLVEYPLKNLDKQIVLHFIRSIVLHKRTYDSLRRSLDLYMMSIHGFSEPRIKRLLYDLLANSALVSHSIETMRYFLEMNRLGSDDAGGEGGDDDDGDSHTISTVSLDRQHREDELWLNDEQIRLVTHRCYSKKIYREVFIPLIHGNCREKRTIDDILVCLDRSQSEQEQVIDVQEMRTKLTIVP